MGFIIGCILYIVICEGICRLLGLKEFNKKAWVYAVVSVFGGAILKSMMA